MSERENIDEIVDALRCCSHTEDICGGCGAYLHNKYCHGDICKESAALHERQESRIAGLEQQLAAERAKYAELQRYNVDCTKQCDTLAAEKIGLKTQLAASRQEYIHISEEYSKNAHEYEDKIAEGQRREQAAIDRGDELRKAFALACRILSDNLPVHLPDNQSWQDHILDRVRTEMVCRVCGCTDDNACPGGCYWVKPDLCSACAQAGKEHQNER